MDFQRKDRYGMQDLLHIMKILRSPQGCPWDREQTHQSIRSNFIEETYEAVEAIDTEDRELLQEELGDVLLQVVFHAQMEEEQDSFRFDDVVDGICKKLIVRHPHIFSDVVAHTSEEVLKNWDAIKMSTKAQRTQSEAMDSVSRALPSLMRSAKIQQKAAKVGFDWPDVRGALDKVSEELGELKEAVAGEDAGHREEELGDLLFSVVNVARFLNIDSEYALSKACDKFVKRFSDVERLARENGMDMKTSSLEELDSLWEQAKKI
ncbi:MAG: nucleoside triphosphate pyrophosphohydrolase [Clostridiales bacterium]|nr:nucleoside triphosphate pyrophosphohydrolase [Clostridiales bacterium]